MALYYLDWYSIKYLEGGRLSKSPNKGPSRYLKDSIDKTEEVVAKGAYILYATKSGKPEVWEDVPQTLNYYKFKDEIISPIISGTNAKTALCICSWPAYESLLKVLSINNINSRRLITTYLEDAKIDSLSSRDLKNFDIVILTDYKYKNRNKAFNLLKRYIEDGGAVLIDTGGEVRESKAENLPEIFPFGALTRKGLGKAWELSNLSSELVKDVNVENFSPLIFDKFEWNFS